MQPLSLQHPRVLVTPPLLNELRQRAHSTHRRELDSLSTLAATGVGDKEDPSPEAWRLAFLYLLTQDDSHASAAMDALIRVLALPVSGAYFVGARRLKALACAYDWLHGVLNPDMRRRVGQQALAFCQALYDSGEIEPTAFLSGHGINQIPYTAMAGIAIGDELDGALDIVSDAMSRLEKMLQCYRHFLEKSSFPKSYSYTCTYMGELPYLFQAMEAGLGIDAFEKHAWWRNVVTWWTYALRDDDTFNRQGDYFCSIPVFSNPAYYRPLAAIASRYRDPLAQWWVERFTLTDAGPDQILFEERAHATTAKSPEQLPRSRFFPPMGIAVARGDFKSGTVAQFKCTPLYLHNHAHRDANSITIYHKGDLAIDSGAYDGYETPHWYNYYIRTIAHNTLVVYDPSETFDSRGTVYANDGGQRFVNHPHFQPSDCEDIHRAEYRDGRILTFHEGAGWTYVCGDASRCYSPAKLKRFWRHVVFLFDWPQPASVSLVVLDDIELTRANLTPRILLHSINEPAVDGRVITMLEGRGRLTTAVLTPDPVEILKIGGRDSQFMVDGRNYALKGQMTGPHTPGAWRVEIAPSQSPGTHHQFLTVLMPTDHDAAPPPRITATCDAGGVQVNCGERIVKIDGAGLHAGVSP